MITKGIIKTLDYNGNTCTVHMPLFETPGNDPIIETATISNTPGSYNGYKVGDVVWVAFEDGSMDSPVVIGKLYLGAEAEKADPRGVLNVENSSVAKTATMPADTKLSAELDSNVPNTTVPFSSLSSLANNLNTLNTTVAQNDRDYGNRFKQVISNADGLRSTLEQTADNIRAEVVHKKQDGTQEGLGWDLNNTEWTITAKDTINGADKSLEIFKVEREGVSISGDLRLNGYPKETIIRYAYGSRDSYPDLYTNISAKTINNKADGVEGWTTSELSWSDTKYIWQWTQIIGYQYNKADTNWTTTYQDKVICVGGGSATSYWLKLSTPIHTGHNQNAPIIITAYKKHGDKVEEIDDTTYLRYKWDLEDAEYGQWSPKELKIETNYQEADLIIQATHDKEINPPVIYEEETITYSPLNTPTIDLSNDSASLPYNEDNKIGDEVVSSTASVYLNGKDISNNFNFNWSNNTISSTISVSEAGEYIVVATLKENNDVGVAIPDGGLKKVFSVSKVLKGDQGIQGLTGRKVLSTVKYYMLSDNIPSAPNSSTIVYDSGNNVNEWYKSPISWPADYDANTWSYYETVRTTYEESDGTETIEWSDPVKNSMLTVDFINALGITAQAISIPGKFKASNLEEDSPVEIAGFNVSENGIYSDNFYTNYETAGSSNSGVYVGTDGIRLGDKFYVDTSGTVVATSLKISDTQSVSDAISTAAGAAQSAAEAKAGQLARTAQTAAETNAANAVDTKFGIQAYTDKDGNGKILADNLAVRSAQIDDLVTDQLAVLTTDSEENKQPILLVNATVDDNGEITRTDGNVQIGGFAVHSSNLNNITDDGYVSIGTNGIVLGKSENSEEPPFMVKTDGELTATKGTFNGSITASGSALQDNKLFSMSMEEDSEATFDKISARGSISTTSDINSLGGYFFGTDNSCGFKLVGASTTTQEVELKISTIAPTLTETTNSRYCYYAIIIHLVKKGTTTRVNAAKDIQVTYTGATWSNDLTTVTIPGKTITIKAGSSSYTDGKTVANMSNFSDLKFELMHTYDLGTRAVVGGGGLSGLKMPTGTPSPAPYIKTPSNLTFTQNVISNANNIELNCNTFKMNGSISMTGDVTTDKSVKFKVGSDYYEPVIRLKENNSPNCFFSMSKEFTNLSQNKWVEFDIPTILQGKVIAVVASGKYPKTYTKNNGDVKENSPSGNYSFFVDWSTTKIWVFNTVAADSGTLCILIAAKI